MKYKCVNEKKTFLINSDFSVGFSSAIVSSTLSIVNTSIGIPIANSSALLTSIAILITSEYISKLKIQYTKLRDWASVISLLYEKTLKQSMFDKILMIKKHMN